jgi:hypothetical protein
MSRPRHLLSAPLEVQGPVPDSGSEKRAIYRSVRPGPRPNGRGGLACQGAGRCWAELEPVTPNI